MSTSRDWAVASGLFGAGLRGNFRLADGISPATVVVVCKARKPDIASSFPKDGTHCKYSSPRPSTFGRSKLRGSKTGLGLHVR